MRPWLLALPFVLVLAAPAAALECDDNYGFRIGGNLFVTGKFLVGERYTEVEIAIFDQMELRRRGIDATRAERWAGCVRAWVRQPDGTERQQFFDPRSYEKLDLTYR
jgi:hypothetical protein